LTILLTLLFLLTVFAWVRSYWVLDDISGVNEKGVTHALVSFQGALHFSFSGKLASPHHITWFNYPFGAGAKLNSLYPFGSVQWSFLGFKYLDQTPPPFNAPRQPPAMPIVPWLNIPPFRAWVIPYWAVALLVGAVPGRKLFLTLRWVSRRRKRLCPRCGYDLRATPNLCPECGANPNSGESATEEATTSAR
jgi:hypothetical protein